MVLCGCRSELTNAGAKGCETAKRPSCSGSAFVDVVQTAQHRPRPDRAGCRSQFQLGRLQPERAMRTLLVVVRDEFPKHRQQVALVEDDHVVETLSPEYADDAFDDRVRTRRSNGCSDGIDTDPSGLLVEVGAIDRVPIAEQVPRLIAPGRRLDQLTPHPGGSRAGGHVDMHQLTPTMGDEDQHVQRLEGQGGLGEQVGRPQVVSMVAQEGAPGLARCARWSTPAVAPNRAIADDDAQLEQPASDPFGTPESVLAGHGHDEVPDLEAEVWPATSGAGLPTPEQTPALPMPTHHRVRRDEAQVLAPAGAEP